MGKKCHFPRSGIELPFENYFSEREEGLKTQDLRNLSLTASHWSHHLIPDEAATYSVQQIILGDFDDLLLGAVPVPHVDGRLLGQLTQDEEQQLVVVALEGQVPGEVALHRLHDRILLGVDERLEHHPRIRRS